MSYLLYIVDEVGWDFGSAAIIFFLSFKYDVISNKGT